MSTKTARRVAKAYGVASVGLIAAGAGAAAGISGFVSFNLSWFALTVASMYTLASSRQSEHILLRVALLAAISLCMGVCLGAHVGLAAERFGMCEDISEEVCVMAQYVLLGASMLSGGILYGLFAIAGLLVPSNSPDIYWAKVICASAGTMFFLSLAGSWFGLVSEKMHTEVVFLQIGLFAACASTFEHNAKIMKDAEDERSDIMWLAAGVVIDYVGVTARVAYYVARTFGPLIVAIAKEMCESKKIKKSKKK